MLVVRTCEGLNLLERESYLVPMEFEDGWPVFNRGVGKVQFEEKRPNLPWTPVEPYPVKDEFNDDGLVVKWFRLRMPRGKWYELADGKITLDVRPQMMTKLEQPSLLAQRISEFSFDAFTKLEFTSANDNEEAGFMGMYNNLRNFRLVKTSENGEPVVKLYRVKIGEEQLVATEKVEEGALVLGVKARNFGYQFYYGKDQNSLLTIGKKQEATVNASQSGVDFTGPMVGIYGSSNG